MIRIHERPSLLANFINRITNKNMSNINGPTYKVSDEEFNAMVISYKLQDGTVSLEQLQEAARHTRVPEVVLNAHAVDVIEVLGSMLPIEVKDEVKVKATTGAKPSIAELAKAAKLRIERINHFQTKEEVEEALKNETAKSVLKAGAAKLELLKLNNS